MCGETGEDGRTVGQGDARQGKDTKWREVNLQSMANVQGKARQGKVKVCQRKGCKVIRWNELPKSEL